jgi:GDP-L-fucose synthase|tara:strand:+ start:857 stop:1810 length:954 start_codon:yes stop_codon:yes gene_type:complete
MYFRDKKVVVTGGGGMIGTHYIKELLNRGAKIRTHTHNRPLNINDDRIEVLENINLENIEDCEKLIHNADYVIHSAGQIAHPSEVPTDFQIALSQITLFTNVLETAYKCGVRGFLDIGSSTGYPDRRYPITEDEYWDDEPYISYYGYGWMRRYREKVMEHCSHISDMKIGISRGTAMFGPYDNFNPKNCHVIPALINRVLKDENPLVVWGSPDVVRDFLYVKDVVNGALLVLEKGESMRPYNLGCGSTITIGDIVDTILKVTGKNPKVEWDNSKPTTIPFRMVSIERIQKELGFKPKYTFEEGIRETIEWYLKMEKV